jgi:DNA adenine methylase
MSEPLLPLLKWAGGKRKIAPKIAAIYENHRHRRLVEPFCGGLSIALHLRPEEALLNDINEHLINFYQWVFEGGFEFKGINTSEYYYEARARFNDSCPNSYESAQDFYYLNLAGFNGLCRFSKNEGNFNVPYGKRKKLVICEDFEPYKDAIDNWEFSCKDYYEIETYHDDFLVVDPPYDAGFVGYSGNDFGWQDQVDLVHWLQHIYCPIIAHNLATDRIIDLYTKAGFAIELINVGRSINCDGAGRQPVIEMFATKGI